jgi:tRNA threonylcarbamoyl adenosine modification protein YeaZ
VDGFIVGAGPGSFTGLRVGITTARTLAHSLNKPLLPISSLEALLFPVHYACQAQKVTGLPSVLLFAATDAAKGEFFLRWGYAHQDLSDFQEINAEPDAVLEILKTALQTQTPCKWLGVGQAIHRYPKLWNELPADSQLLNPSPFGDDLKGGSVAAVGHTKLMSLKSAGLNLEDFEALKVRPNYLRDSAAQVNLQKKTLWSKV